MKYSELNLDSGCFLCLLSMTEKDGIKILTLSDSYKIFEAFDDGIGTFKGKSYHDYSEYKGSAAIVKAIIQKSNDNSLPKYRVNSIFFPGEKTNGYQLSDFLCENEPKKEVINMRNHFTDVSGTPTPVPALLQKKETKSGKKGEYLDITLSDKISSVIAKDWNRKSKDYPDGSVVNVWLSKDSYGYRLENIEPCFEYTQNDFIKHPPMEEEKMFNEIKSRLEKLSEEDNSIAEIAIRIFDSNREELLYWSAASSMHHNTYGGLLYHTYRMILSAEKMCEVYSGLDKELLITATALHDIGKLSELNTDKTGTAAYSEKGNMLGHSLIGVTMIEKAAKELGLPEDDEKLLLLKHCIASHHGQLDFGAITLPSIFEAQMLNLIDMTDSRAYMYEAQYNEMQPGETMTKTHFGLGTKVYRPEFTEGIYFNGDYTNK